MSVLACERWRECWLKIRKRILLSKNKKQKKKEFHIQSTETKHRNKIEISQVSSFGYSTPVWLFVVVVLTLSNWMMIFFLNENWSNWKLFKKHFHHHHHFCTELLNCKWTSSTIEWTDENQKNFFSWRMVVCWFSIWLYGRSVMLMMMMICL